MIRAAACCAILAAANLPATPTLVPLVAAGDPTPVVERLIGLGRTIDLSDPREVAAAIGPVDGLPTRKGTTGFAGYTVGPAEIAYNPDGARFHLLVTNLGCIPLATMERRVAGPEFHPAIGPTTVALYVAAPYVARPTMAFTYSQGGPGCVRSFGLSQWKRDS